MFSPSTTLQKELNPLEEKQEGHLESLALMPDTSTPKMLDNVLAS